MSEITYTCIHENKHHSYSDVFGSREIAKYRIGRPDGSPMKLFNVSEAEAISIVTNLPDELLEVVKQHYGLVEAAATDVVENLINELPDETPETPIVDGVYVDDEGDLNVNLEEMTVKDLKSLCKQLGITGYSDLNKEELIAAINQEVDDSDE